VYACLCELWVYAEMYVLFIVQQLFYIWLYLEHFVQGFVISCIYLSGRRLDKYSKLGLKKFWWWQWTALVIFMSALFRFPSYSIGVSVSSMNVLVSYKCGSTVNTLLLSIQWMLSLSYLLSSCSFSLLSLWMLTYIVSSIVMLSVLPLLVC
jgi:hypothetical protein